MDHILEAHAARYPHWQTQDALKLCYQGVFGCGHLLDNREAVTAFIRHECAGMTGEPDGPLTEALPGGRYVRLSLRRADAEGIPAEDIAGLMFLTQETCPAGIEADLYKMISETDGNALPCTRGELLQAAHALLASGGLPSHSDGYRLAYRPAYRVIAAPLAQLLPILAAIRAEQAHTEGRLLIGIDGRCAAGKSTLGAHLAKLLDCPLVHMDDFYTPHAQKTPDRLAQPGGNADIERFRAEVIVPWCADGTAVYRPYSCGRDRMTEPVVIAPSSCLIIEGSYCLHPKLEAPYSVRVFMDLDAEEQLRRLATRETPESLDRFKTRWIPLENAYFSAYALPDTDCIVIRGNEPADDSHG